MLEGNPWSEWNDVLWERINYSTRVVKEQDQETSNITR